MGKPEESAGPQLQRRHSARCERSDYILKSSGRRALRMDARRGFGSSDPLAAANEVRRAAGFDPRTLQARKTMARRTLPHQQGWASADGNLPMGVNGRPRHEFRLSHGSKYKYHSDQGSGAAAAAYGANVGDPNSGAHTGVGAGHGQTPGVVRKIAAGAG